MEEIQIGQYSCYKKENSFYSLYWQQIDQFVVFTAQSKAKYIGQRTTNLIVGKSRIHCSCHHTSLHPGRELEKHKFNEPGRANLKRQISLQQAKHPKLYSNLLIQAEQRKHQRARGDLNFCIRGTLPPELATDLEFKIISFFLF